LGAEIAVQNHFTDGEEFQVSVAELLDRGRAMFAAAWTEQEGAGRPLTKGTGERLTDPSRPLRGSAAYNRVSGPDANSCAGCHNMPFGLVGGAGDIVNNVFVGAERFDFVTFERTDRKPTRGSVDEAGIPVTLETVGNSRATPGLFGAGYVEMMARQITDDLRAIRDSVMPGESKALRSKGVSFGVLRRNPDGSWDTSGVEGLPSPSIRLATATSTPSLTVQPFRHSGSVTSLREFTSDAFNQHIGIQTVERFGHNTDPDGDGIRNEMTVGDVTAVAAFMATLPVPGRVIPNSPERERSVLIGERLFHEVGCVSCHIPALPLQGDGGLYSEPGPSGVGNRLKRPSRALVIDLSDMALPQPRLQPIKGPENVLMVPTYSDFKLHDITDPDDATAREPLDINERAGSEAYRKGNRKFLTARLWGAANQPPFFHHGLFTTLKQAVLAHAGEAANQRRKFESLPPADREAVIDFLDTLQVLPAGTRALVVDEQNRQRSWPPERLR
jgi:cytochrome c peroxidase